MRIIKEKWVELNWLSRIAYILVAILFLIIPIEILILESFNIAFIDWGEFYGLIGLSVLASIIAREWKLILISIVGAFVVLGISWGLSSVIWYYLNEWFGIDISYRYEKAGAKAVHMESYLITGA